jgi:small subunit ribosomal protein S13
MARIVGVDLPRDKRVEVGLTYIFGVGRSLSQKALAATGVDPNTRVRDLSEPDVIALRDYIEANYQTEGDLRREVQADIRRKVEIGSWSARAWTAHAHQCADPQGQAQDRRRQEEGRQVIRAGV